MALAARRLRRLALTRRVAPPPRPRRPPAERPPFDLCEQQALAVALVLEVGERPEVVGVTVAGDVDGGPAVALDGAPELALAARVVLGAGDENGPGPGSVDAADLHHLPVALVVTGAGVTLRVVEVPKPELVPPQMTARDSAVIADGRQRWLPHVRGEVERGDVEAGHRDGHGRERLFDADGVPLLATVEREDGRDHLDQRLRLAMRDS